MRRNSAGASPEGELLLRPRYVRHGWGRVDGGGHRRAAELVRLNADRSARRRVHDHRIRVVRELLARHAD